MPATTLTCPECDATLRLTNPVAPGKKLKCPKCAAIFTVPDADEEVAEVAIRAKPRPTATAASRKPADEDNGDDEVPVAKARKAQPVEDDEDNEPADEEPEDRPRKKLKKKRKEEKKGKGLLIGLIVGGVVLLLGGGAAVLFLFVLGGSGNKCAGNEPLGFIGPDMEAVINFDGSALMAQQALAADVESMFRSLVPADVVRDPKGTLGIEPKDFFDRVVLAGAAADNSPIVIIRSKTPFDQKKVAKTFSNGEAKKEQGKTYYLISAGTYRHLFMPSNTIMIFAAVYTPQFSAMFKWEGTQAMLVGDLATMAKQVEGKPAYIVAQIKPNAGGAAALKGVPGMDGLTKSLEQIKAIGVWATLEGGKARITGQAVCADEKSAKDLVNALNGLKTMIGMFAGQVPADQQELFKEFQTLQFLAEGTNAKLDLLVSMQSVAKVLQEAKKAIAASGSMAPAGPQGMRGGIPGRQGAPGRQGVPGRPGG